MLSRKAKYGLKAILYLAQVHGKGPVLISDLAAAERIPKKFLEQILLELRKQGLLFARRGRGGGYELARPPRDITMGSVIRILDGPLAPVSCVSQTAYRPCEECLDAKSCGIRLVMQDVRDAMADILDHTDLAAVLLKSESHRKRGED
ncbi:MAG TPA: Rrf2 family transcriptional regulator [Thermoanaerobaculia bacterium]|nr:Rrf2 family transcriptional regulator [Thermoanaerobaculia bacterium]HXK66966.1 Rrf2 family transcriptional regulator [Thermoanaerobaculia bacterium]